VFVLISLDDRPVSQRTGLRERKSLSSASKNDEPTVTEVWTPEEDIELWRIKDFFDRFISVVYTVPNLYVTSR
jgi:hypothetical protein